MPLDASRPADREQLKQLLKEHFNNRTRLADAFRELTQAKGHHLSKRTAETYWAQFKDEQPMSTDEQHYDTDDSSPMDWATVDWKRENRLDLDFEVDSDRSSDATESYEYDSDEFEETGEKDHKFDQQGISKKMFDEHKRMSILFYYKSHQNASVSEIVAHLNASFGVNYVKSSFVQFWLHQFKNGRKSIYDEPKSGRPKLFPDVALTEYIRQTPGLDTNAIAEKFSTSPQDIEYRLKQLGFKQRTKLWVPHKLSDAQELARKVACENMLAEYRLHGNKYFEGYITVDEKYIMYENPVAHRYWYHPSLPEVTMQPQREIHCGKVLLVVFWDHLGPIYHSYLENGQPMTAARYCVMLKRMHQAMKHKRKWLYDEPTRVKFYQDNARPHTAKLTSDLLASFKWNIVQHPPYSPDIAACDFYLFRSMQGFLRDTYFHCSAEAKKYVDSYFRKKGKEEGFYERAILKLAQRWQKVVDADGDYFKE